MTVKKRSSNSVKKAVKKVARKAVKTAKAANKEVKRSARTINRAAVGTKKKSSKNPAKKKTIAPKASVKKIFPKKRPAKRSVKKNVTPVINLINSGANLLKKAVVKTEEKTAEGRNMVKTEGLGLVDSTSKVLHSIITGTSDTFSDGLKKL